MDWCAITGTTTEDMDEKHRTSDKHERDNVSCINAGHGDQRSVKKASGTKNKKTRRYKQVRTQPNESKATE